MVGIYVSLSGKQLCRNLDHRFVLFVNLNNCRLVLWQSGGGVTFEQKAHQCELGGGLAVIIYNNVAGYMSGGLSNATAIQIPAVQTTAVDGQRLKAASTLGQSVSVQVKKGYGYLSGTSMAVPHVTGVIGKIWRAVRAISSPQ